MCAKLSSAQKSLNHEPPCLKTCPRLRSQKTARRVLCAPKWRRLQFRGKIKVLKNSLKLNLGYNSVSNYQFAKLIGQMLVNKWPVLWKCCKHEHLVPGEWRDGIIVVDRCIATPSSILVHLNAVFFYKPFWAEFNRIDSDFGDLFCDVGHTLLIPRVCWVF